MKPTQPAKARHAASLTYEQIRKDLVQAAGEGFNFLDGFGKRRAA